MLYLLVSILEYNAEGGQLIMDKKIYDVLILGGGPAGLAATVYARRANMDVLLIEKGVYGGLIYQTAEVDNYPGGVKGETGADLSMRMAAHAESFSPDKVTDDIVDIDLDGQIKTLTGQNGVYKGKTIIVATGNVPQTLGIPGEEEFVGRGVSYCATCDGPFFTGLNVFVVGGGDSAVQESLHLSQLAKKVTIIHRRGELRAAKSIQEKAFANEKMDFMLESVVREIKGDQLVKSIVVENLRTGEVKDISASPTDGTFGVFIFAGMVPQTKIFENVLNMENGYIITDEEMRTNISGVFAAGDVRKKMLRQVVTAAADGAIAAVSAEQYIE
jgi:thioredoxin reductase (NADPH)